MTKISEPCVLCSQTPAFHPIRDAEKVFCCPGCHAVFTILSAKNQLDNFQENPLFKQALRSGLISNPALLEQIRSNQPEMPFQDIQKIYFEVSEMWCPACSEVIQLILLQEKGVKSCMIDYATDLASVEFSPRYISKDQIYRLIHSLGYRVLTLDSARKAVSFSLYLRFIIAAFCSLNVMMFAYPLYATYFDYDEGYGMFFAWLSFFISLPVVTYSAWPIVRHFWTSCRIGIYGMEALVILGVSTAFGLSFYNLFLGSTQVYFDSMTVIITFMLLGKIIEARAKFSAKDSLLRLARAIPRRGRKRFSDGSQQFVSIKVIHPGDLIVAGSGEKIVLDGVVVEGEGNCDESLITGESLPVQKKVGSRVIGGAIVQNGMLVIKVEATAEQSTLQRILDMVQQEIGRKTAYTRSADSIMQWFIPSVLLIAFGSGLISFLLGATGEAALIQAISVLLISCPCAIGIAAPIAESYVMNALAQLGAIVRNRGCLALLGNETAFIFDKTGTITEGKFNVVMGLDEIEVHLLSGLKALASHSAHPVACAIARSIDVASGRVTAVEEFAGKGMRGVFEGKILLMGSLVFLKQHGIVVPKETTPSILSSVYIGYDNRFVAVLMLGDRIRAGAKEAVAKLSSIETFLVSGDAESTVAIVAQECGFGSWKAGCNPLEKRVFVESLRKQGHIVCMLGDGINDAPALTAAHVGISVVTATDISIQVSDILLTTDQLGVIPQIRLLAKKGRRIIKQNLFWAFFYNVIGIGLAAFGLLSPLFAACAMVLSSLMVIFNAKRIA